MTFSRSAIFAVSVGGPLAATTRQATLVGLNGSTLTLDREMPVGHFVTGEPFIVSDSAFSIIATFPASADLGGEAGIGNGMMERPFFNDNPSQGFDEYIANSDTGGMRFGNSPYSDSLNVDPSKPGGVAISIAQGTNTAFVKSKRLASVTNAEQWQTIEYYDTLYIVSSVPPEDAYPPSCSAWGLPGTVSTFSRRADVDETVLQALTFPGSWTNTYNNASGNIPGHIANFGHASGERARRFRLDVALGTTSSNYSRQIAVPYAQYLTLLHRNGTLSAGQRQAVIDRACKEAIQFKGLHDRGWAGNASLTPGLGGVGAGQSGAHHPWVYYGAFLLQDTNILATAQALNTSMNANGYWGAVAEVGSPAPGKSGTLAQTFFAEHIGVPFIIPDEWGSEIDTRYGVIAGTISIWETLAVTLLQNGPGGVSGTSAMLKGGAYDATNPAAAHLAYMTRTRHMLPWPRGTDNPGNLWRDLYDLVQPIMGVPEWTGQPDQLPLGTDSGSSNDDWFSTPGTGTIAWNISGHDYATETVTRRDLRYSLDGVQWIEVPGVAADGTMTGLMQGTWHYAGLRQASASGSGPWSNNYPSSQGGSPRGLMMTGGTPASTAPSFATAPAVCTRLHPRWNQTLGNWYEPSSVLLDSEVRLSAGVGYQAASVYPAPTYTYQWQESANGTTGWTDITIANGFDQDGTDKEFSRRAENAARFLRCQVTASNGTGAPAVTTTNVVACPANPVIPATTLFDTEFGWDAVVAYEAQVEGATLTNSTLSFRPDQTFSNTDAQEAVHGLLGDYSPGALLWNTTGAGPKAHLPMANPAQPNTTYDVHLKFVVRHVTNLSRDWYFDLVDGINGPSLLSGGRVRVDGFGTPDGEPFYKVITIIDTITTGATPPTIFVEFDNNSSSGGGGPGGYVSQVTIRQAP